MKYIDWTDERVAELTRLWAAGLSASRIAEVMGLRSRNMVVGKVNRLALPKPERGWRFVGFEGELCAFERPKQ